MNVVVQEEGEADREVVILGLILTNEKVKLIIWKQDRREKVIVSA